MDNTGSGSSKMPWGINAQQIAPSSLSTISDTKLVTFALGQQKKSRFQKAREGVILLLFPFLVFFTDLFPAD